MKKNTLMMLALTAVTLTFTGCGNNTDASANNTVNVTEAVEIESTETIQESEAEVGTETVTEVADADVTDAEPAVETVAETVATEPEVEMVDFETWAKQEGNEEVYLVVWNEELGKQEIMPTLQETKETYPIQNGDRFAIPYNEKINAIRINKEIAMFPNTDYLEIPIITGEVNQIVIIFENQQGEDENINFVLK